MQKFPLGAKAHDVITGFSGTITGYVQYLTGCNQYLVSPPLGSDGTLKDAAWLDEQRLEQNEEEAATRPVALRASETGGTGFDKAPPKR